MLRIRTAWSGWAGGPGLSTFYFTAQDEGIATVQRLRLSVQSVLNGAVCQLLHTTVHGVVGQEVDVLNPTTGQITNTLTDGAVLFSDGYGSGGIAPPATAALVHFSSNLFMAGRRVRGRMFVSPLAASAIQPDGTLDETGRGIGNTAWAAFLAGQDAGDKLTIWHRPKAGAGGGTAFVTGASYADKFAVLTSRRD